ncbi:HIT family protein [Butyrivibrio sp. NC3005]|uniref:HIT family protein n=1 Tax=Butyrivibrio sp. NC3005 TaxID=1280685 RepID=UPI00041900A5|nr:HIT domain-containing protein [Butyrivibrio sp. NC3005]
MKDEKCIFCKIANGEIPTNSIYEDEDFNVILDNGPATAGHALILPKEHYANLYELPEDTAAKAMKLAKKVALRLKAVMHCDGLNLVQNNGEVAGQTVNHFHLHVIPRYENDGQTILWKPTEPDDAQLREICANLKMN